MTASISKIIANRLNARRSTGPRTVSGKRRASQNALQHGLSLPSYLFPPTQPLFEEVYLALKAEIAVSTIAEAEEPIANADWRPIISDFLDIQDPRRDPVACQANTILDLCRLRAARKRLALRIMEDPNDPSLARELQSLVRYGNRLNSQLKRLP